MRRLATRGSAARAAGLGAAAALLLALAATGLLAAPAAAHDLWIEPATFRPQAGVALDVALRVGQGFAGEPVGRNGALIERFVLVGPGGRRPIGGPEGGDPAGRTRVDAAGAHVIAFQSRPIGIELPAPKFESYLAEEGLDGVIAARERRGERLAPGREVYSRCAKAIVVAAGARAAGGGAAAASALDTQPLGLTLEIVPEASPLAGAAGQAVPFRILYDGRPLADALVVALHRDRPDLALSLRSDAEGRAALVLPHDGPWLVKVVHMVPAIPGSGADWESFWASLTFERTMESERMAADAPEPARIAR